MSESFPINKYSQYIVKMPIPDEVKKWNLCVKQAKEKEYFGKRNPPRFGFIDKKVVKSARRCYCAMAFLTAK